MPLDAARWIRLQQLFHEALMQPDAKRPAWARAACGGDAALEADLLAMLEADASPTSLLERGLPEMARDLVDDVPDLPDHIGPYHVLGVAGVGGMGVVYEVERPDLGSRAAIKVLRDAMLSPARRARFANEQRMLAQLDHPAIARLYDADTLPDGTPYFVMEYVAGEPLTSYAGRMELSVRQRLELFRDVCSGVRHAHAAAIIHRDIKPSNILVRDDGTVKLLDFGIARQLADLDDSAATRTVLRMMTPAYAAPEQLSGAGVGTYTDVYALGAVLYELLTGAPPYDAAAMTPATLERAVMERLAEPPSRRVGTAGAGAPDASRLGHGRWAELDTLCAVAMHPDPARRYATVDALIRDVTSFLEGRPLDARGDSRFYRLDRFIRRNARQVGMAAAAAAAMIVMTGYYTTNLTAARDAALLESARAWQTREFLLNLFQGGDPTLGPTDSLRVIALLERGASEAHVLDDQPLQQAELYATLGVIHRQLGRLTVADSLLRLALDTRRRLLPPGHPDIGTTLVAVGLVQDADADVASAERLIREGLGIIRTGRPVRRRDLADASMALGTVLRDRGAHDEAIDAFEEALDNYGPDPSPAVAQTLVALAGAHFYAGRYDVSDSLNSRALAMSRELYGPRHPRIADALINLGAGQFERGNYREAERLYRQALDIKSGFYGEDHHQIAANRSMLGRALVALERYDEALAELRPALGIRERAFGASHPAVASTLNEIGTIHLAAGELEQAESSYVRMLAIYNEVYGGMHAFSGTALSNLSNVYMERGDLARAAESLRQAVAQFAGALGPDHSNTAIARIKLGRVLRGQGRLDEALAELKAGYAALAAQVDPGSRFLQVARTDLAAILEEQGDGVGAARWRDEHATHAAPGDGQNR